jgi:transposase InsO family protein
MQTNSNGEEVTMGTNGTGMKKSRTTSYHPMGNGMCERFNRTLLNMLGSLESHQKQNWKAYLGQLLLKLGLLGL